MHRLAIILLSVLLTVAPVYGQAIPVAPTPTPDAALSSEQLRFLDALEDRFQQVASADNTTVNFAVVIIGIGFLLFMAAMFMVGLWVARGGLTTFTGMIRDANRRADNAEVQKDDAHETVERELERRRMLDEQNLAAAQAQTRTLQALEQSLNSPMTRLQPVINAVNSNTNNQHEETRKVLDDALKKLDELEGKFDKRLDKVDESIRDGLGDIRRALQQARQTNEVSPAPAPTPPAEGDTLSSETKTG